MSNKADMKGKLPYSVPEGYFESLGSRLSAIPEETRARSFKPVYAFAAAALAAVLVIGGLSLRQTPSSTQSPSQISETDEIIDYLIDSGTSLCYLEEALNQTQV